MPSSLFLCKTKKKTPKPKKKNNNRNKTLSTKTLSPRKQLKIIKKKKKTHSQTNLHDTQHIYHYITLITHTSPRHLHTFTHFVILNM